MTSEITLFVNPTAGRGRGAHAAQPAASALRAAGFRVRTVSGQDPGDALARARAAVAEGTGALVAVGGDGVAHLALQAVAGTDTPSGWSRWAPATTSPAPSACPCATRPRRAG
ncbi:hypothetical protein GCM10020295_67290 [Streptomyces cinereospinus]